MTLSKNFYIQFFSKLYENLHKQRQSINYFSVYRKQLNENEWIVSERN